MNNKRLENILRETFGEPIGNYVGDAPVGVRDEQDLCPRCGMMPTSIGAPCQCNNMKETRIHVSPQEVEQTWDDLSVELGEVSLDVLSSWLGADSSAVEEKLPHWLSVDENGNVVEAEFV